MGVRIGDLECLARCHSALTEGETVEVRIALAHYAHNLLADGLHCFAACRRLQDLAPRVDFAAETPDPLNHSQCRSLADLCRAIAGDWSDPTRGAVAAHRHDESPDWSETAQPTALIGPWIFYRLS